MTQVRPQLTIKKARFWAPDLLDLLPALRAGLMDNYRSVAVDIVPCPDLRALGCAMAGLSGSTCLVEVGGEPYAHNPKYRDIEFDAAEIAARCQQPDAAILGAGMVHRSVLNGHCGEWIPTLEVNGSNRSKAAWVASDKSCVVEDYASTLHSGLSNLFLSRGEPGPVLRIQVERRIGSEASFSQAIRKCLIDLLPDKDNRQLGLGGVFVVEAGQVRSHISPDYECITHAYYDVEREEVVADFLQFYDHMGPDLLCFSVLWTGDPTGGRLHLRESGEHSHFFQRSGTDQAGHYHYDITPKEIKYTGYFNLAEEVYRVNDIYEDIESRR